MSEADERNDAAERPEAEGQKGDPFGPPEVPCECYCLHCRRTFMSDRIWFQRIKGARDGFDGFWMCPTPNCSGKGFTFDIFPVDPDHPANAGWYNDDEYSDEHDEAEWDPDAEPAEQAAAEYDPDEPTYKELDEIWGDEDEDIEGEEWKYGLQPGEVPDSDAMPPGVASHDESEEEALYNSPDKRPRELDWSDRERSEPEQFSDDDIPF